VGGRYLDALTRLPLKLVPDTPITCFMGEDPRLIGRLAAGAGGLLLLVSVFLTWYSLSLADVLRGLATQAPAQLSGQLSGALPSVGGLTLDWSGWHSVHTIRFVLLLLGAAVLLGSVAPPASARSRRGWFLLAAGLLAAVLAVYRIESPPSTLEISVGPLQLPMPPGTGAALSQLVSTHAGLWVALLGGALVMLGGWSQLPRAPAETAELLPTSPLAPASQGPPRNSPS
jgi:hypothetical protein